MGISSGIKSKKKLRKKFGVQGKQDEHQAGSGKIPMRRETGLVLCMMNP